MLGNKYNDIINDKIIPEIRKIPAMNKSEILVRSKELKPRIVVIDARKITGDA